MPWPVPFTRPEPVRILHVIRGLANSSGTTHIVVPLSEAQACLGHAVCVMHVRKGNEILVEPRPDLVTSLCFAETPPMGHLGPSLGLARALRRHIASFDVVHLHAIWNFPTWYGMRRALHSRVPFIVAPQGSLEPWAYAHGGRLRRLWAQRLELPLLARSTRLQALTTTEADQMAAFGLNVPMALLPNGVEKHWLECTPRPGALAARLHLPPGSRTLLFLSRLHPKKGLDLLLKAFAASLPTNLVLVVAGSDAGSGYGEQLRALAGSLGIANRCFFLGEVKGEQKRALFQGADAFALPSHSEGLPVAVLEAMASALPVLITPGCNLPQVAEARAGLVVPAETGCLATGLTALFADEGSLRAMGARGRDLVRTHFTWPQIANASISIYTEMQFYAEIEKNREHAIQ
jgi:glycosyltransferase involved in cell wall biosynthesis